MKNKYIRRAKISESKFRQIIKLFALDLTAIKECEFRFNYKDQNLYKTLFKILKKNPCSSQDPKLLNQT